jgi:hypothetical protein
MKRLKFIGLALAASLALAAVAASAASAAMFKAETYPVTIKAHATNFQGFQITGSVTVCKKLDVTGSSTADSQTLEVHPVYSECEVALAGTFKAKVDTTGCNYLFHAASPSTNLATVDVKCEAGKEIITHVEGIEAGCEIKVPSQNGLKKIEFVNEGSGSARKVSTNATVTGITWSATGGCGLKESSGSNGEYKEGKFSAIGTPELGPGQAKALTEGFTELNEPDGVFVKASPRYTKNGTILAATPPAKKTKTLVWGKLKLKSAAIGESTCETVGVANVFNPENVLSGKGETLAFTAVECVNASCPKTTTLKAVGLPWPSELIEEPGGNIRSENTSMKVINACEGGAEVEFTTTSGAHEKPLAKNGSGGCNKPGEIEFDAGSGNLVHGAEPGSFSSSLKTCGYEKQDLIGIE